MKKPSYAGSTQRKPGVSLILRCFMLLILVVAIGVFISKMITFADLTKESQRLQEEKVQYEQEIRELEYRINNPVDYEDIIRIAREKLNLAFPDDTVYYNEQTNGN